MTSPDVDSMLSFNTSDYVARATCNGDVGWGLLEHANLIRHALSGSPTGAMWHTPSERRGLDVA